MKQITAIGFDLFNTLITVNPDGLPEANSRLVRHLESNGFSIEEEIEQSSWYLVSNSNIGEISESGLLRLDELKSTVATVFNFVISNS